MGRCTPCRTESARGFSPSLAVTVGGGVLAVLGTPEAEATGSSVLLTAGVVVLVLAGWAVSLCLHEFGHAYDGLPQR